MLKMKQLLVVQATPNRNKDDETLLMHFLAQTISSYSYPESYPCPLIPSAPDRSLAWLGVLHAFRVLDGSRFSRCDATAPR